MTTPFNDAQLRWLLETIQQHPAPVDGVDGPEGPPGPQGPQGPQGEVNVVGVVGPQGPQGEPGERGADGRDGTDGRDGADGVEGPRGSQGSQGATGPRGPKGPKGDDGPEGPQGPAGKNGAPGGAGMMGVQGPQGVQGADGADGGGGVVGDGPPLNPDPTRYSVTMVGSPDGGTYTYLIDIYDLETSETVEFSTETAPIAFDATNTDIAAAIEAAIAAVGGYTAADVSVFDNDNDLIAFNFPSRVVLAEGDNNLTGGSGPQAIPFLDVDHPGTNGDRGHEEGTLWIDELGPGLYVNFGGPGLQPDGSSSQQIWERVDAVGRTTEWEATSVEEFAAFTATQGVDLNLSFVDCWYRLDPVGAAPYPVLNLFAKGNANANGTPAEPITFDLTTVIADVLEDAVVPDFFVATGTLTINNRGPFALIYEGTATLKAYNTDGDSVGDTITLVTGDVIAVNIVGTVRDSD